MLSFVESKRYAFSPYLSVPKSSTRIRISLAWLKDCGTPVQPVAFVGAAPANGGWPAKPAGWSNWRPKAAVKAASSVAAMKFVVTPRPEKKPRKSTVGPSMAPTRPPAHSICATFLPPRSAACARVSAWTTPVSNAAVRLPNGWPLT